MRVLVINPIMYTSETENIKRAESIKDTMMYDLCLAFHKSGHTVTLVGAEPFKPLNNEDYPFDVVWWDCSLKKLFKPHCLPYMPKTRKFIKKHGADFDMIISSEVFSVNSLMAYRAAPDKLIIWHELAKHNNILKKIPSKIWYNLIVGIFMRNATVIARSEQAKSFIYKYCKNTQDKIIDHGVNLDKFPAVKEKSDYFVVCSQLIERKRIDGILRSFAAFQKKNDSSYKLYIIGSGDKEEQLKSIANELGINENVIFKGKMSHNDLIPILSKAKALLINTIKDNNMISIVESIAVGTPILTTDIPLNSEYIKKYQLGIAKKRWNENDLQDVLDKNEEFVNNCIQYRENLSTQKRVEQFTEVFNN